MVLSCLSSVVACAGGGIAAAIVFMDDNHGGSAAAAGRDGGPKRSVSGIPAFPFPFGPFCCSGSFGLAFLEGLRLEDVLLRGDAVH